MMRGWGEFTNHGDTESTEKIFLPDRETRPPRLSGSRWRAGGDRANREPARRVGLQAKRGEKIAALRARSSNPVASDQRLETDARAFAVGEGSFPWPSSPGQGKNTILRVLCASVVNLHQAYLGRCLHPLTPFPMLYALCSMLYASFQNYNFVLSVSIHYTSVRKELDLEED